LDHELRGVSSCREQNRSAENRGVIQLVRHRRSIPSVSKGVGECGVIYGAAGDHVGHAGMALAAVRVAREETPLGAPCRVLTLIEPQGAASNGGIVYKGANAFSAGRPASTSPEKRIAVLAEVVYSFKIGPFRPRTTAPYSARPDDAKELRCHASAKFRLLAR